MTRKQRRVEQTGQSIRDNIADTVREVGGELHTIEGLQLAGWQSEPEAVDAHKGDAFEIWLQLAPRNIRESRKLYARFLGEWPAIVAFVCGV